MKGFLIDVDKCVGCYACQIACKDEHCGNDWMPYSKEQPEVGQFWLNMTETERGNVPHVKVDYIPLIGGQNSAIEAYAPEVLMPREDGLIVIDPEKAKGRKDIADKFEGVYWNEELQIPQSCTGCAHLLDDPDSPIRVPRCVDNCHKGAIQFGDLEEMDLEGAVAIDPENDVKPRVYYKGLTKKFIAATVYDPEAKEIVEGATVTATGLEGEFSTTTNAWGDFWLNDLPDGNWTVTIEKDGKKVEIAVSTMEKDQGLGDVALA